MTTIDIHTATLIVLVCAIGWLMAYAGLGKNALEQRRRRRVCPSCGRNAESCGCS